MFFFTHYNILLVYYVQHLFSPN